ncbi:MAG: type II toxin-antitoxin system VapC family toxin, partial [Longimicrobiaceae bacterium]
PGWFRSIVPTWQHARASCSQKGWRRRGEAEEGESVILCDAGPLVALVNSDSAHHERCVATLKSMQSPALLTTYACFTKAMHLLQRAGGWQAQEALWNFVFDGLLQLHAPVEGEWQRMRVLMRDYADTPMDLADASIVAAAETLGQRRVFTVDWHFYVYRQRLGEAFEVVP